MGIGSRHMKKIYLGMEKLSMPWDQIKMGEFGAQRIVQKTVAKDEEWNGFVHSKKFFKSKGVTHVSFDINFKWGSLYLDLSKIQTDWQGAFDIVTDYGTSEHVRGGQYQVFANAHNFTRKGGIMCHCNPMVGRIQMGHPVHDSVYYHEDFYKKLADLNGYEVIDMEVMKDPRRNRRKGGNLTCVLRKVSDSPFCSEKDFWMLNAIDDYSKNMSLTRDRLKYAKEINNKGTGKNS